MSIEAVEITKTFGQVKALNNVSLKAPDGELVALLGPSGCGKTTLLRIIAGLEVADENSESKILFNGLDMSSSNVRARKIGFVFQHYALFRHMTVFENVSFGLRVKPWSQRPSRAAIKSKVLELLKLVQLSGFEDRYPSQLSGGQRQRVALARALAIEPKALLLDEPFGALDARVRQDLRKWLRKLHDEIHITSLFVTHDQEEALEVADRVVVMNKGRIEQEGSPEDVFHNPSTEFVMNFLGNVNLFHGRVEGGHPVLSNGGSSDVRLFVRPYEFDVFTSPANIPENHAVKAKVKHVQLAGPAVKLELFSEGAGVLSAEISHERFKELGIDVGSDVLLAPRKFRYFPEYVI